MAQTVVAHFAQREGLAQRIVVDSAGTHAAHIGEPPDARARASLLARGYPLGKGRSRKVTDQDFERFDLILAMDGSNLKELQKRCPTGHTHKLHLFMEFASPPGSRDVPDPYFGNAAGFERVLDLCETGARGLMQHIQRKVD
jgi:protein-tyrosine phosphatase